jgi:hypothetical protein
VREGKGAIKEGWEEKKKRAKAHYKNQGKPC